MVGMHQDLTYWGMGETSGQVTAWLALGDSNKNSGCMEFVKGSHKNKILPHNETYSKKACYLEDKRYKFKFLIIKKYQQNYYLVKCQFTTA